MSAETKNTVEELLRSALERFECGDRIRGWRMVIEALSIDPGISHKYSFTGNPIRANLDRILSEAKQPSTFTGLAAICRQLGDEETSKLLLGEGTQVNVPRRMAAGLKAAWQWFRHR